MVGIKNKMELNKIHNMDAIEGLKQLHDNSIDLVLTDPPYNVNLDYDEYQDGMSSEEYYNWCKKWFKELDRITKKIILITPGCGNDYKYWTKIRLPDHVIIWHKSNGCSHTRFGGFNVYEPILYYKQTEKVIHKIKRDVINQPISQQRDIGNHPCPKPLKLFRKLISDYSNEGDIVLDPFAGVGTTGVVAKKLKRNFVMVEIEEEYCLYAEKRLKTAEKNNTIQGYSDGIFRERNSLKEMKNKSKKERGFSRELIRHIKK